MRILRRFIYFIFFINIIISCSKKHVPSKEPDNETAVDSLKTGMVRKRAKPNFPKIITVNDAAAKKSMDGRLYYDVMGHRYWKNYANGKYYLFNKSMYNNPDFKAR